ncbi:hypothetical protein BDA96_01G096600 [Sorghum bicolor]|uniref:Uncharacterized protein n=2 Tax=Sorghum bicolor TaxID=4558 RepID=A0A921RW83_SORBI|nr:hypothetical protein BDA96_01G096600 [Sorghum bicolor]OQU91005.1 hypothetical protein SORBI_3001G092250 [Sorghum bicolor]
MEKPTVGKLACLISVRRHEGELLRCNTTNGPRLSTVALIWKDDECSVEASRGRATPLHYSHVTGWICP